MYVLDSSSEVWYGVCEDKRGYFDSRHVKLAEISNGSVSTTERTSVIALSYSYTAVALVFRFNPFMYQYGYMYITLQ